MPVALLVAFALSLGLHATALFGPEFDLLPEPEAPPLQAELRPLPPTEAPPAVADSPKHVPAEEKVTAPKRRAVEPKTTARKTPVHRAPSAQSAPKPLLTAPPETPSDTTVAAGAAGVPATASGDAAANAEASATAAASASKETDARDPTSERLPPRGRILYRVDSGDSGFQIGVARQEWSFADGRYRLRSTAETTGLAWLIRSLDIEMESLGELTKDGLRPEVFGVIRDGRRGRERALFDWEAMRVRISEQRDYPLVAGAQDFMSVFYQLGTLDIPAGTATTLPLATGKKFAPFRVENLGDETTELPLGALRTRHLRLPGENTTELWLAYDYRLLPVKIRYVDKKGNVLVQVATAIQYE